ncbi:methyltransferase domain-containing protein [Actinomadura sp. B10D3]|uniref:methyltransferase domain-containing protein n=1 Tax=Actinomadura sp. B10D3 TaxID=3153557 RepID=UPI00325D0DD6
MSGPRAQSFDIAAVEYAASRPSYPAALFDSIEEFAGCRLAGARVADVGAGTGIASVLLRERGADVIAVEPGEAMAGELRRKPRSAVRSSDSDAIRLAGLTGLHVARRQMRWSRTVSLDVHLANIGSRSAFLVLDDAARHAFFVDERERLRRIFPHQEVEETYVVDLLVALRS